MSENLETLVVGAGISGLACAHALRDTDVQVWDAAAEPGGLVRTVAVGEHGLRYEAGPEALAAGSEHVAELARAVGVEVARAPAHGQARFVVRHGALLPVPMSPPALLGSRVLSWRGKLRLLSEPWRDGRVGLDGSIAEFTRHRLGSEVLEALVDPMVSGIYGGDPEHLSLRACAPAMAAGIEEYGSVFGVLRRRPRAPRAAKVGLWKPRGGMQDLTDGLARALGTKLRLGMRAESLRREGGSWVVASPECTVRARHVVVALPLAPARSLLAHAAPAASAALADMTAESLVSVLHAYRRADVAHSLSGFGYLVPSREKLRHLGTLFSSSIDAECAGEGVVLLRTLLGGARDPVALDLDDAELHDLVAREAAPLLGIGAAPLWATTWRYPRVLPRFDLEHPRRQVVLRSELPTNLTVLGNFTDGVGLSSLVKRALSVAGELKGTADSNQPLRAL